MKIAFSPPGVSKEAVDAAGIRGRLRLGSGMH
jgi:hypothetical protein